MAPRDKPHVIRLRGPWELTRNFFSLRAPEFECSAGNVSDVRLPARAGEVVPADFRGGLELKRSFNWPEPLGYRESLWLVVVAAAWPAFSVELNGQPLGTVALSDQLPAAWEITSRAKAHNSLRLGWKIDGPATLQEQSWVDVQLEVRLEVGPQG